MQLKNNDQRMLKKKKKKKSRSKSKSKGRRKKKMKSKSKKKKKKKKATPIIPQNDPLSPPPDEKSLVTKVLSKDVAQLKSLPTLEPWIKRDELDVRKSIQIKGLLNPIFLRKI